MNTTLGDLKTQIVDFIDRTDLSDTLVKTAIDTTIRRIHRQLRLPNMERLATSTLSSGETKIPIPSDLLEVSLMSINGNPIDRKSLNYLTTQPDAKGIPTMFAREAGGFRYYPTPDQDIDISMVYYEEYPPLVDDTDSNELTEIMPDALLFGALVYLGEYLADARVPQWDERFRTIVLSVQEQADQSEYSGSILTINSMSTSEY